MMLFIVPENPGNDLWNFRHINELLYIPVVNKDTNSSIVLDYQKSHSNGALSYDIFQLRYTWNGDV